MSSPQLASLIELPRHEVRGVQRSAASRIRCCNERGRRGPRRFAWHVLHERTATSIDYLVDLDSLSRHVFVAGATGSGKTNTIFQLLLQAHDLGAPFMVLEPAKTEYRDLLSAAALNDGVSVFTAGDENVSPLRLNPFDVPPDVPVSTHIDLLRAAFGASFGMWTPLPQVLERCLHAIYADYGWDVLTNRNARIDDPSGYDAEAFPTLGELIGKIEDVVPTLGMRNRSRTTSGRPSCHVLTASAPAGKERCSTRAGR